MSSTHGGDRTPSESRSGDDSFDALLKEAVQVSAPAKRSPGASLATGTRLADGRLTIQRRLGEGGMGVVYEALDGERRTSVALKTLTRMDADGVYRLKNEFRALTDVTHENLVGLHELFSDGELWCFTMDLVEGERFDRWVRPRANADDRSGQLDEGRLRDALPQLVEAVGAIHAAGKLHRDLKPSNVLVTHEGRVVVLDFGLAVDPEVGGVGQTVADDGVSGTPAYMAPEQATGEGATAASDFYAVGVMLFEALTGELPFEGRGYEMLVDKQREAAPRARDRAPDVPDDLDALCAELLAREPERRPDGAALHERLPPRSTSSGRSTPTRSSHAPEHDAAHTAEAAIELVGREAELAALDDAFESTVAGQPVVLFVSGESGMGKSALCHRFLHELRSASRATVLWGRCHERENVPYKALDSLVDDLSRHLRKLSEREAAALLPRDVHALTRLFPVLGRIGVVAEAPDRPIADPGEMQRRAFDAFGEFAARLRDRRPLVIFIDDLQWTDQDSVRFMRHLLLRPDPVPALVVLSHRSEGAADNAFLSSMREAAGDNRALSLRTLTVGPLSEQARADLATKLLGETANEETARAVARESGGSPFFVSELAHAAQRGDDTAQLSLGEAVSAHVATLSAGAQRILQALALAGQPLPAGVVLDAVGLPLAHRELEALRSERLVRVSGSGRSARRLECYHDKVRESVGEGLSPLLSRELSAGLARALASWPEADPELVTRCLEGAGSPQEAGEHAAAAADAALEALAFDRAARLYDKALELADLEPARLHALRVSRAHAFARAGRGELAGDAYLAAREGTAGDEYQELSRLAGEQLMICGQLDRGRELLAETIAPHGIRYPKSLPGMLAAIVYQRGRLRMRGLHFRPRETIDPAIQRRLAALQLVTHTTVRSDHGRCAAFCAQFLREALDAGDTVMAGRAIGWEIGLGAMAGVPQDRLEAMMELGEALCDRTQDQLGRSWLLFGRGWARMMRGDNEAALKDFDAMIDLQRRNPNIVGSSYDTPWAEWFRSTVRFELGRFEEVAVPWLSQLESCWARRDLTLLPHLVGGQTTLALLAVGRGAEMTRELDRVEAAWSASEFMSQDNIMLLGRIWLLLYRGEVTEAWRVANEWEERARESALARVYGVAGGMYSLLLVGPAYARTLSDGAERRMVFRGMTRFVKDWERREARGAAINSLPSAGLRAALYCMGGENEQAVSTLRGLVDTVTTSPLRRTCARRCLGELLGGNEGASMVAEADAFLRAGGAVDPARLVATLMPGITPPDG